MKLLIIFSDTPHATGQGSGRRQRRSKSEDLPVSSEACAARGLGRTSQHIYKQSYVCLDGARACSAAAIVGVAQHNTDAMEKVCPRCGVTFECLNNDIVNCQCADIGLTHRQRMYLSKIYPNCLCHDCLLAISKMSEGELAWMAFKKERHM